MRLKSLPKCRKGLNPGHLGIEEPTGFFPMGRPVQNAQCLLLTHFYFDIGNLALWTRSDTDGSAGVFTSGVMECRSIGVKDNVQWPIHNVQCPIGFKTWTPVRRTLLWQAGWLLKIGYWSFFKSLPNITYRGYPGVWWCSLILVAKTDSWRRVLQ